MDSPPLLLSVLPHLISQPIPFLLSLEKNRFLRANIKIKYTII